MPTLSRTRTRCLLAVLILLTVPTAALATPEESGISRSFAIARAARVSNLHYRLSFSVKEHEAAVVGTEAVTFESKSAGDLPIDCRDGALESAKLNGRAVSPTLVNDHLTLTIVAGQNTLMLAFTSNAAPAGKAITRYEDQDDGSEYFYT
jgi:aminopeptidase N